MGDLHPEIITWTRGFVIRWGCYPGPWAAMCCRQVFSWVRSRIGSTCSNCLAVGHAMSSKLWRRNGQGRPGQLTRPLNSAVFCVPFTQMITWTGATSPRSYRCWNISSMACMSTGWAIACGRPAEARVRPWCNVWNQHYVVSKIKNRAEIKIHSFNVRKS